MLRIGDTNPAFVSIAAGSSTDVSETGKPLAVGTVLAERLTSGLMLGGTLAVGSALTIGSSLMDERISAIVGWTSAVVVAGISPVSDGVVSGPSDGKTADRLEIRSSTEEDGIGS